jgi:DegV family protein with EDD domain
MSNVRVLTDSIADIPPAIQQALGIKSIPCIVRFGNHEYRDRVDIFPAEFYEKLGASSALPFTSQPAIGIFEQAYRELAETTNEIIAIHTVGSLSGIYNTSHIAAQNIQNAKIVVVDSKQVSMGVGWLVILAARAAQAGKRLAEIKELVNDAIPRAHLLAMLDTLEYARRGGRLGKGKAWIGTLLNVKPIVSVVDSQVVPVENVRTQKRALERMVEMTLASGNIQELSIIHAQAPELALTIQEMFTPNFPRERIVITETGPVLGAHVGPGAVGLAWLNS